MQPPNDVVERLRDVRALVLDMDGVFTDGGLYLGSDGAEMRRFDTRDGLGVKMLLEAGYRVALVSGRSSAVVAQRMAELGVAPVHQGVADKGACFDQTLAQLGIVAAQTAAVGDDLPDLPMLARAAVAIAPADAVAPVRAAAHWVTVARGGHGAVREIADALLAVRERT